MLYLISLGLKKDDISIDAIESLKDCDLVYIERYTSLYEINLKELERLFNKKIIELKREDVESNRLIEESKKNNIALLVPGDCLTATTHISLLIEAKKQKIRTKVIHGPSILTAVVETGLSIYKFGAITSIPFNTDNIKTPIEIIKKNQEVGLHTLILLDLNPGENKYVTIKEASSYLIKNGVKKEQLCIGCARLGKNAVIKKGKLIDLMKEDFGEPPYSLIIIGNLGFLEEEASDFFRIDSKRS